MGRIRVLVVEDSPTVRHRLCEVLAADPDVDIAAVADNGRAAIEETQRVRPDVITMDIMLPSMSGLAATEYIMGHFPTPILVVSSSDNRSELFTTYDALAAGAVDVLEKPTAHVSDTDWERQLRAAVKLVSRIPVITHPRARLNSVRPAVNGARPSALRTPVAQPRPRCQVVVIGASTGGPGAVVEALNALPAAFSIPILLVQHISAPFATAFVEWLGNQIGRRAMCARDGERVGAAAGRVIVAPADRHLTVHAGRIRLTDGVERHSCRPSVDTLFESAAAHYAGAATGCLLTGMGRDGAAGLLAIRRAGGLTIAQDEASSVVYGMPREAVLLDAVDEVLTPAEIGRRLATLDLDLERSPRPAWQP
jgi:two-component system chemotaxis response regulator CheB